MVNEADRFASEDKAKREAVETKNNAESMVYQTEKQIKELGDKVGFQMACFGCVWWMCLLAVMLTAEVGSSTLVAV